MEKFNINIDRKEPSSEEIAKMQDFSKLVTAAGGSGIAFTAPLLAATLTLVLGLGMVCLFDSPAPSEEKKMVHNVPNKNGIQVNESTTFVKPDIPFETVAYNGHPISFNSVQGSYFEIPSKAFLDEDGNPVNDNVEIKIREFHDPVAVWCSEIPMNYDSSGIIRPFESAGMIELRAYKNGEELKLAPGKEINVEMISYNDESRFNYYHLDDSTQNWIYLGKDSILSDKIAFTRQPDNYTDPLEEKIRQAERKLVTHEKVEPKKPAKKSDKRYSFDLEIDVKNFPYLAQFKEVKFEVLENQGFNANIYDQSWSDARLSELKKSELYQIELISKNERKKFKVLPILSGADLEKAMRSYNANLMSWELKKNELKQDVDEMKAAYQAKVENWESEQKEAEERAKLEREKQLTQAQVKSEFLKDGSIAVKRKFKIRLTGICNIDYPLPIELSAVEEPAKPKGKKKVAAFMNKVTNAIIIPSTVYIIEKGKNLIYGFKKSELNEFSFNPNEENTIWFETTNGKIAVFRSSDFKTLEETADAYHFIVDVSQKELTSKEELEVFLLGKS